MAGQIGSLAVRVSASTKPYVDGMRKTIPPARKLRRDMNKVAARAGQMAAAVTAAGAALTAALVNKGIAAATEQRRLARSLELTNRQVAGLSSAFRAYNLDQNDVSDALNTLTDRASDAASGMQSMADDFALVGLEVDDLKGKNPQQLMTLFADAIASTEDPTKRAAAMVRTFGDDLGRKLMPLLMEGSQRLRQYEKDADALGLAFTGLETQKLEEAHNAMATLGDVIQGVSNRIAVQLAPLLEVVAGRFRESAIESEGFKSTTMSGLEDVRKAVGFVADSVEGLRRTFQLAGRGFAVLAAKIRVDALQIADVIVNGPIRQVNGLIELMNRLPGMDLGQFDASNLGQGIFDQMQEARRAVQEGLQDMQELANKPMPSDSIEKFWSEAEQRAREAAEEFQSAHQGLQSVDTPEVSGGEGDEESDETPAEREARRQRERLNVLRNFAGLQTEFQTGQYEQELERLKTARENELLTEKEFRAAVEETARSHQQALTEIERAGLSDREKFQRMSMKNQVKQVAGSLEQMTASVARENKAMFRLNQVAGIANAIVNTAEGVTKALSAYPPPLSFAMAAAQAAAGAAQISAIKSQSFSAGGSAPSQTGTTPVTQQPGAGQQQNPGGGQGGGSTIINLQGETFGRQQVRDLIEELNEAQRDGGRIVVA